MTTELDIIRPMRALITAAALLLAALGHSDGSCHYMKERSALLGYETAGPYKLKHFGPTKGRTELRQFLWNHWHNHRKGVGEARISTIDAGIVKVLYVVQPDAQGHWGIDVELDRQLRPLCTSFHVDLVVRLPISKSHEGELSQAEGNWPPDKLLKERIPDSEVKKADSYRILLLGDGKAIGDAI